MAISNYVVGSSTVLVIEIIYGTSKLTGLLVFVLSTVWLSDKV